MLTNHYNDVVSRSPLRFREREYLPVMLVSTLSLLLLIAIDLVSGGGGGGGGGGGAVGCAPHIC